MKNIINELTLIKMEGRKNPKTTMLNGDLKKEVA